MNRKQLAFFIFIINLCQFFQDSGLSQTYLQSVFFLNNQKKKKSIYPFFQRQFCFLYFLFFLNQWRFLHLNRHSIYLEAIIHSLLHFLLVNNINSCSIFFHNFFQSGDTVLIGAVRGGHVEIVRALLHKYADIDIRGQVSTTVSMLEYFLNRM